MEKLTFLLENILTPHCHPLVLFLGGGSPSSGLWSNRRKEPFLEDLVTIMSACPSEDPDPTPVDSPLSSGVSKETDLRGAFRGGCGMYPARRSFVAALPPLLLSTMSKEAESPTSIGRGHSPIAYSAGDLLLSPHILKKKVLCTLTHLFPTCGWTTTHCSLPRVLCSPVFPFFLYLVF